MVEDYLSNLFLRLRAMTTHVEAASAAEEITKSNMQTIGMNNVI